MSILAIILIWIVSILFTIPILKITKYNPYDENNETLHQCLLTVSQFYFIYMIIYTSIIIFIPTAFLSFLYMRIMYKLKIHYKCKLNEVNIPMIKYLSPKPAELQSTSQQSLSINKNLGLEKMTSNRTTSLTSLMSCSPTQSPKISGLNRRSFVSNQACDFKKTCDKSCNERKRFTMIILFVTVAFFCCQLPVRIFIIWSFKHHFNKSELEGSNSNSSNISLSGNEFNYEQINIISFTGRLIYFLHGISNPLIYNISSSKFRRSFFSLFCFSKR
jgi:hypothetical protein